MSEPKIDRRRVRSQITRQKIITSAIECYKDIGIEKTFMEHVANQAGIGRATLYRHFKNQDEILTEVVLLELEDLKDHLNFGLRKTDSLEDYITEGCLYVLRECPKQSITPLLFKPEASSTISRLSLSGDHLIALGVNLMKPFYDAAKKEGMIRKGVTLPQIVEWVTRFLISFMANPSEVFKTKQQQKKLIENFLLPSLMNERPIN